MPVVVVVCMCAGCCWLLLFVLYDLCWVMHRCPVAVTHPARVRPPCIREHGLPRWRTQLVTSYKNKHLIRAPRPPRSTPLPITLFIPGPLHLLVIQAAAQMIKNQLDRKFGSTWHVVCGEGFAVSVLYQQRNMIHVYYGKTGVMAFKC